MGVSILIALLVCVCVGQFPVVVNTWSGSFSKATQKGFDTLVRTNDPVYAIVEGCRVCQSLQCDFSVGFGGSPDESGDTTLDAMVIDGHTMKMGAVGFLRGVKDAIGVAYEVYRRTEMTLLAGEGATSFAKAMGFQVLPNLETPYSEGIFNKWKASSCQPNYWVPGTVSPNPLQSCGPYAPLNISNNNINNIVEHNKVAHLSRNKKVSSSSSSLHPSRVSSRVSLAHELNHDTIGMVAVSASGHFAAGVSTNGLTHKIVGRVGDSPLPGAGAFADSDAGGCAETGDGDIMLRFSPCALVVEWMRGGMHPADATKKIITRIASFFPTGFVGGIVAVDTKGRIGAAAYGWTMTYSIVNSTGLYVLSVSG